jgi:hypothetical protein
MAHRFQPPLHTSGIFTPHSGEIRAGDDGILELPESASEEDRAALLRAGCLPEGGQSAPGLSIASYCDAYIAGEGRDDDSMLEFAVNHGPEIEAEFTRRAALAAASEPSEAAGAADSQNSDDAPQSPEKAKGK